MKRVWLLGIEPIVERYSEQWSRWIPDGLRAAGCEVHVVTGRTLGTGIRTGQFLDVYDTHVWKASQLIAMTEQLAAGYVRPTDTILLTDAWSPTVTALAYMRDAGNMKFHLAGMLHAGTYDPKDFLTQKGLGVWAQHVERGWVRALDTIFVATEFHKTLLRRRCDCPATVTKIHVTGFPLYAAEWLHHRKDLRTNTIVFPHRLAFEKAPHLFAELRDRYERKYHDTSVEWVKTKDACATKTEYYELLGRAKVSVSVAEQETWGIAMLESVSLGCIPVAPKRLSYPETLSEFRLYETLDEAVDHIQAGLYDQSAAVYNGTRWETALFRIAEKLP